MANAAVVPELEALQVKTCSHVPDSRRAASEC